LFKIIPEKIIKESAFMAMKTEGEDNSFFRLLEAAEGFRKADLTPVYILNAETMDVMVIAKETYNKRLH
jgi:hypothetical protein